MRDVAALFVARRGESPYWSMDGVDCWDEERDAMRFRGSEPVIAHPPCRLWGTFWWKAARYDGWPKGKGKGEDGGMFRFALEMVRRNGGILEHPYSSSAWAAHGVSRTGETDLYGGTFYDVDQGWWGYLAPKRTGLYVVGAPFVLPDPSSRLQASKRVSVNLAGGDPRRKRTPLALACQLVNTARAIRSALEPGDR